MNEGTSDNLQPSERVVAAVAEREGVDPTDLHQPLDTVVDPEALDDLFADRLGGKCRHGGRVVFRYYGYHITVEDEGDVTLEPAPED
jgi:hypothetical protein